jgi:hypothetical protein
MPRFDLISLLILFLIFLAAYLVTTFAWKGKRDELYTVARLATAVLAGFFLIIMLIALAPFNPKYWFITAESGEVTRIETQSSIDGSGSSTQISANVVLTLDSGKILVLDDARALNFEVGNDVNLRCQTHWVYGGADKITCIPN